MGDKKLIFKEKKDIHKFWIRVVDVLVILCCILLYNNIAVARELEENEDKYKADLAATKESCEEAIEAANYEIQKNDTKYKDGKYEGKAQGYGGDIKVSVTVEDGKISNIKILSHKNEDDAYFNTAKGLIEEIISSNSTDVDTVSGATFSSKGIINATKNALKKGTK